MKEYLQSLFSCVFFLPFLTSKYSLRCRGVLLFVFVLTGSHCCLLVCSLSTLITARDLNAVPSDLAGLVQSAAQPIKAAEEQAKNLRKRLKSGDATISSEALQAVVGRLDATRAVWARADGWVRRQQGRYDASWGMVLVAEAQVPVVAALKELCAQVRCHRYPHLFCVFGVLLLSVAFSVLSTVCSLSSAYLTIPCYLFSTHLSAAPHCLL